MDGENLTSIRKRSKAQGWIDSYWFSIDGAVNPEPKKIQEVPREGQVFVMNIQDMSQTWIQYLYPELYKKLKKEATERENILRRKEDDLRRREENREIRKKVMLEVQLLRLIKLDFLVSERMPDETISEIAEGFARLLKLPYLKYLKHIFKQFIKIHIFRSYIRLGICTIEE